jgi:hypothetical protein
VPTSDTRQQIFKKNKKNRKWWKQKNKYYIFSIVLKFVSDLPQVSSFLRVLRFPPPIKLTATVKLSNTLVVVEFDEIHSKVYIKNALAINQ